MPSLKLLACIGPVLDCIVSYVGLNLLTEEGFMFIPFQIISPNFQVSKLMCCKTQDDGGKGRRTIFSHLLPLVIRTAKR